MIPANIEDAKAPKCAFHLLFSLGHSPIAVGASHLFSGDSCHSVIARSCYRARTAIADREIIPDSLDVFCCFFSPFLKRRYRLVLSAIAALHGAVRWPSLGRELLFHWIDHVAREKVNASTSARCQGCRF